LKHRNKIKLLSDPLLRNSFSVKTLVSVEWKKGIKMSFRQGMNITDDNPISTPEEIEIPTHLPN